MDVVSVGVTCVMQVIMSWLVKRYINCIALLSLSMW